MFLFRFALLTLNPKYQELKNYNRKWIISALELFMHLEYYVHFWASQCKKSTNVVEEILIEGYQGGQVPAQHELQGEAEALGLSLSGMQTT